jgi:hypothetical protein
MLEVPEKQKTKRRVTTKSNQRETTDLGKLSTSQLIDTAKSIMYQDKTDLPSFYDLRSELFKRKPNTDHNIAIYPEVDDPDFTQKLSMKKEFSSFAYPPTQPGSFDKEVKSRCDISGKFQLTKNQKFLKNFLSPETGYNSVLLFHGTGVGKTCTAINIAEQFDSIYQKKIIVLMPTNLKDNFKKQLFDVSRINSSQIDHQNQCIAHKYLKQILDRHTLDKDVIDKRVNQMIKDKYQFYGFREFANIILNIKKNIEFTELDKDLVEKKLSNNIKNLYSDCVFVIDEAHNVRAEGEDTQKIVPPLLLKVLQSVTNVKLIILTATPMFNESREIIWLLNLILANEKRPLIDVSDIFDGEGNLVKKGAVILQRVSRGYVSYMRGQNPFAFPVRLDPTINNDKSVIKQSLLPKLDIYGTSIKSTDSMNILTLIGAEMSAYQTSVYKRIERTNSEDSAALSTPIQISNIVYPSKAETDLTFFYGEKGFYNCFEKLSGSTFRVQYKQSVKQGFGEFLSSDKLSEYSAKLSKIINYINNAEGIVFVYSYYLWSGILPLAIALEHAGYQRSSGNNILANASTIDKKSGPKLYYSILTGDSSLTPSLTNEIEKIRSTANKDGQVIKVILGTNVTSEGFDFKCIREVHILEPWHHLNRLEQIVGRAIRTCSHISLPIEKRNTTIYNYASYPSYYPKDKKESIDLRMYRLAAIKQFQIQEVEDILRSNAIDCILNKNISYFDPEVLDHKVDIVTSQKKLVTNYPMGDNNKALFKQIKCAAHIDVSDKLNSSTFTSYFYRDEIELYKDAVSGMYIDYAQSFTFDDFESQVKKSMLNFDPDILKFALDELVKDKNIIMANNGIRGYLSYYGNRYTLLPESEPFAYITNFGRKNFEQKTTHIIKLEDSKITDKVETRNNTNANIANNMGSSSDVLNSIEASIHELLTSILKSYNKGEQLYLRAFDYMIDRLDESKIVQVATEALLNKHHNAHLAYESLHDSGLLLRHGSNGNFIYYLRSPFSDRILLWKKNKFEEPSPLELASYLSINANYVKAIKPLKDYTSYVDISDKGIHFKRLITGNKSNGYICTQTATLKVKEFIEEIRAIDSNILDRVEHQKKARLCEVYELLMRIKYPLQFARPYIAIIAKTKIKK